MSKKSSKEPIRVCMKCFSPLYDWLGKSTAEAGVVGIGGPLTGVYTCSKCMKVFPLSSIP